MPKMAVFCPVFYHCEKHSDENNFGAEAEASKSASIFSMLTAKVGIDGNANFSREGSAIITKAIENITYRQSLKLALKLIMSVL